MRKSNLITLLSLCLLIAVTIVFMLLWKKEPASAEANNEEQKETAPVYKTTDSFESESEAYKSDTGGHETEGENTEPEELLLEDALFIGDSRTVGLMEYAQLEGADFFCTTGMSVFNIHKNAVSVPGVGNVTLTKLLDNKKYGKIYVMLGVNEMGYQFENIMTKYNELIDFIKEKESGSEIIIHANLHVTKKRSDSDKTFNNAAINKLNSALAELAADKGILYMDVNSVFDDESGALDSGKSSDNTHLYAKYYTEWGKWIKSKTASLIREG